MSGQVSGFAKKVNKKKKEVFLNNNSLSSLLETKQKHCPTNEEKINLAACFKWFSGKGGF